MREMEDCACFRIVGNSWPNILIFNPELLLYTSSQGITLCFSHFGAPKKFFKKDPSFTPGSLKASKPVLAVRNTTWATYVISNSLTAWFSHAFYLTQYTICNIILTYNPYKIINKIFFVLFIVLSFSNLVCVSRWWHITMWTDHILCAQ